MKRSVPITILFSHPVVDIILINQHYPKPYHEMMKKKPWLKMVDPLKLIPTQRFLFIPIQPVTEGPPVIILHTGRYFIQDGHHRVAKAILNGNKYIKVRVLKI